MTSQRITWFWPASFLAALGQFLLLLTRNDGGPETVRLFLALWTFWLPGVGIGNLLTKPGTRLAARLPVQFSAALAVVFVLLLLRGLTGAGPRFAPMTMAGLSTALALVMAFLPENLLTPGRRTQRARRRENPAAAGFALLVALGLGIGMLFAGGAVEYRGDTAAHLVAAGSVGSGAAVFPPAVWDDAAGSPGHDGERNLAHGWVGVIAHSAAVHPERVWHSLPVMGAPLFLLAAFLLGRVLFRRDGPALAVALASLFLYTSGFSTPALRETGFPDQLAWIPFWTAVALFLEGLDDPHLPGVGAFGLAVLAVWGTHFGFGLALTAVILVVSVRCFTSLDRFQEGLPLLVALAVPGLALSAFYLASRSGLTGSLDAYQVPAQGLLVLGPDRWMWDPGVLTLTQRLGMAVVFLFLPVFLAAALRRPTYFYLAALPVLCLVLGNPWVFPRVEAMVGAHVHRLPALVPVAGALVFLGDWAIHGISRSKGWVWARMLALLALLVVTGSGLAEGVGAMLRPDRAAAEGLPRELAAAVADTTEADEMLLAPLGMVNRLAALLPLKSVLEPSPPWDHDQARHRALALREALHAASTDDRATAWLWGSFLRRYSGDMVVAPRHPAGADTTVLERQLLRSRNWFQAVSLGDMGTVFRTAAPPPGPELPAWLDTPPGPGRPPWLGAVTPRIDSVHAASAVGRGAEFRVELRGRQPGESTWNDHDPRGYRVRLELVSEGGSGFPWRPDAPRSAWSHEAPLLAGDPVPWWPEFWTQSITVPVPANAAEGMYSLRVRILPGVVGRDRVPSWRPLLTGNVARVRVLAETR